MDQLFDFSLVYPKLIDIPELTYSVKDRIKRYESFKTEDKPLTVLRRTLSEKEDKTSNPVDKKNTAIYSDKSKSTSRNVALDSICKQRTETDSSQISKSSHIKQASAISSHFAAEYKRKTDVFPIQRVKSESPIKSKQMKEIATSSPVPQTEHEPESTESKTDKRSIPTVRHTILSKERAKLKAVNSGMSDKDEKTISTKQVNGTSEDTASASSKSIESSVSSPSPSESSFRNVAVRTPIPTVFKLPRCRIAKRSKSEEKQSTSQKEFDTKSISDAIVNSLTSDQSVDSSKTIRIKNTVKVTGTSRSYGAESSSVKSPRNVVDELKMVVRKTAEERKLRTETAAEGLDENIHITEPDKSPVCIVSKKKEIYKSLQNMDASRMESSKETSVIYPEETKPTIEMTDSASKTSLQQLVMLPTLEMPKVVHELRKAISIINQNEDMNKDIYNSPNPTRDEVEDVSITNPNKLAGNITSFPENSCKSKFTVNSPKDESKITGDSTCTKSDEREEVATTAATPRTAKKAQGVSATLMITKIARGVTVSQASAEIARVVAKSPVTAEKAKGVAKSPVTAEEARGVAKSPATAEKAQEVAKSPATAKIAQGVAKSPTTAKIARGVAISPVTAEIPQGVAKSPVTAKIAQGVAKSPVTAKIARGVAISPVTAEKAQGVAKSPATAEIARGVAKSPTTAEIAREIAIYPTTVQIARETLSKLDSSAKVTVKNCTTPRKYRKNKAPPPPPDTQGEYVVISLEAVQGAEAGSATAYEEYSRKIEFSEMSEKGSPHSYLSERDYRRIPLSPSSDQELAILEKQLARELIEVEDLTVRLARELPEVEEIEVSAETGAVRKDTFNPKKPSRFRSRHLLSQSLEMFGISLSTGDALEKFKWMLNAIMVTNMEEILSNPFLRSLQFRQIEILASENLCKVALIDFPRYYNRRKEFNFPIFKIKFEDEGLAQFLRAVRICLLPRIYIVKLQTYGLSIMQLKAAILLRGKAADRDVNMMKLRDNIEISGVPEEMRDSVKEDINKINESLKIVMEFIESSNVLCYCYDTNSLLHDCISDVFTGKPIHV
ncbi:flocculation protein FLO11-like isoform X2 [Centruroides sculpturatus]|nr:flocculation protein FLO11-like isoform X2 [Centruroides sculpturatus]